MKYWHLIYCKSREEQRAKDNLQNQGVECFLPKVIFEKLRGNKRVKVEEPLFPSYLFALIDSRTANYNALRSTRGVACFVRNGVQLVKVPSELVNEIKGKCGEQTDAYIEPSIKAGDKVAITQGPFCGVEAIYKKTDGLERGVLLVKLLNSESCISLENSSFEVKTD